MNKLAGNSISPGKNHSKNGPKISENRAFLLKILNNNKAEIKKVHAYLGSLNHNVKIIKKILEDVK